MQTQTPDPCAVAILQRHANDLIGAGIDPNQVVDIVIREAQRRYRENTDGIEACRAALKVAIKQ